MKLIASSNEHNTNKTCIVLAIDCLNTIKKINEQI